MPPQISIQGRESADFSVKAIAPRMIWKLWQQHRFFPSGRYLLPCLYPRNQHLAQACVWRNRQIVSNNLTCSWVHLFLAPHPCWVYQFSASGFQVSKVPVENNDEVQTKRIQWYSLNSDNSSLSTDVIMASTSFPPTWYFSLKNTTIHSQKTHTIALSCTGP